jgi:FkbM family methyltransferase
MPTSNDIKDFIISKISSQYRFHKNYENALNEIFIQEDYRWLVERLETDTVAIDIGAFCGESALYIARERHIKRVYAYEPFPYNYSVASKNINGSSYRNKIKLINAGVSGNSASTIKLPTSPQTMTAKTRSHRTGKRIRILNINQIIGNTKNLILKSDCEGEEHTIFSEDINLANIYKIQIEYHYGMQKLPSILAKKGFRIRTKKKVDSILSGEVGFIYAYRS